MTRLTIKGRKLYSGSDVVGEITGYRETTARWGPVGPGYGYRLFGIGECEPCYCYFQDAVKAAKEEAIKRCIS